MTITVCAVVLALAGCTKTDSNTGASGPGSASAPAGGDQLASASWDGKTAGPLPFDRQVWSDDGNGNLQVFLFTGCR